MGTAGLLSFFLILFGAFYRNAYVLHVFILIMMNVVLGSSLRLINLSGQLSLGHGGFVTLGAYTSAVLLVKAGISSTWLALLLSGLMAALICVILGFPFSRLKGIYFAMITIFFVQVIILTVQQWRSVTGGPSGLQGVPRPDSFLGLQFHSKTSFYFLFLALMIISMLILWAVENSRMGMIFKGIKQADSLSESVGINTMGYKVLAFAIGGFFAGIMGGLYVQYVSAVDPTVFGFLPTIYILIYVIVGGEGSLHRPGHRRDAAHRAARGGTAAQELDAGALRGDPHAHHLPHARGLGRAAAEDPEGVHETDKGTIRCYRLRD